MLYLANPTGPAAREAMASGRLGFIDTPLQQNIRPPGVTWCADNGCFSDKWREDHWWRFLLRHADAADSCLFAVAPDVVGDAKATLERSLPWLPRIRELGYPAAFVAQDGLEEHPPPWGDFDVLFVGGSTEFKLGPVARAAVAEAKARGLRVHMGRVNSLRRYEYARAIGCDSVDGTALVFNPTVRLAEVLSWMHVGATQDALFDVGGVTCCADEAPSPGALPERDEAVGGVPETHP